MDGARELLGESQRVIIDGVDSATRVQIILMTMLIERRGFPPNR